ncbi:MAG: NAD(P)/FAD-dependent oxidoreductase [Syntrophales bacterium]|nr:NAD(P)/FAD-dependent oxidoreductase [Syntrophales bacterium]
MIEFNAAIIGAGVVGLAIAQRLARRLKRIVILEKNSRIGMETSSRNSEVIHAGLYYPSDFLKTKLCVKGKKLLYEWCQKYRIPHRRVGKLVVATNSHELEKLDILKKQAQENGVSEIYYVGGKELSLMEPYVRAVAALFSPDTGIVDSHKFMLSLLASAEEEGAILACRSEVTNVDLMGNSFVLSVNNNEFLVKSPIVINSAGLHSDRIAMLAGLDIDVLKYKLKYCKGNYFTAAPSPKISHLIYPLPHELNAGLGVHATVDLNGRVRFGPDVQYVESIDYSVDENRRSDFYKAISTYLPNVREDSLQPEMCGIRPKLQGPGDPIRDFLISEETEKGLPGFVNLIGIESPGLTASLAIADYVVSLLGLGEAN